MMYVILTNMNPKNITLHPGRLECKHCIYQYLQ